MKLSVTTFPWRRLETSRQLRRVFNQIREIGFEGVGVEYSALPPEIKKRPALLPPMLAKVGLENGGTYSPGSVARIDWASRSRTRLLWVSIKNRNRGSALRRLKKFTEIASDKGITIALHNELRSSFQLQRDLESALSSIPNLSLCLDTAHGVAANVDVGYMIAKYHNRISLVHLKDLRAKLPMEKVKFTRDFVNVGSGVIDLRSVVAKLKEVGYEGQLMLEIEALEGRSPKSVVRAGYSYVKDLLLS